MDSGFRLGFIGSKDIPGTEPGTAYVVRTLLSPRSRPNPDANPNPDSNPNHHPNLHLHPHPGPNLHPQANPNPHPHPHPHQNNHLRFIVKYHKSDTFSGARIVGFEVEAYSVKHTYEGECRRLLKGSGLVVVPRLPLHTMWAPRSRSACPPRRTRRG